MDRESILAVIGNDLDGNAVHSGPGPAERLVAKFPELGLLAAEGIVRHYEWVRARERNPFGVVPFPALNVEAVRARLAAKPMTDAEFRAKLRADIERLKRADDDRMRDYMASLRQRIDELKEPEAPAYYDDPYAWENAWEAQQRRAEMMADVVDHEVNHCTVGLALGCRVHEILVRDDGSGVVRFDDIPERANLPVTIAGSMYTSSGIADDSARFDRIEAEAEVDKRCTPETTPIQREYIRASMLEAAEGHAQSLLSDRWEFARALKDRLAVERRISGADVHALWDEYYGDGE